MSASDGKSETAVGRTSVVSTLGLKLALLLLLLSSLSLPRDSKPAGLDARLTTSDFVRGVGVGVGG